MEMSDLNTCYDRDARDPKAPGSRVLREIFRFQLTENHTLAEGEDDSFSQYDIDIESQGTDVTQENDENTNQVRKELHEDRKLLAALLSLNVEILDTLVSNEQDLAVLLNAVALGDDHFSLPMKLKEMVQRNSEHNTDCLKILKLISLMITSMMMKHTSCLMIEELKDLVDTLSSVAQDMKALDGFTITESGDDGTRTKKTFRTLVSIVKEAQDLVERNCG